MLGVAYLIKVLSDLNNFLHFVEKGSCHFREWQTRKAPTNNAANYFQAIKLKWELWEANLAYNERSKRQSSVRDVHSGYINNPLRPICYLNLSGYWGGGGTDSQNPAGGV